MAKADWCLVSPTTGTEDTVVAVSGRETHTGRVTRATQLTINTTYGTPSIQKIVGVTQDFTPVFIKTSNLTIGATGGTLFVTGISNSSRLTFSASGIVAPVQYYVNSNTATSGVDIPGDPGATAQYNWRAQVAIPVNNTIYEREFSVTIVAFGVANPAVCIITQEAGAPTLVADPDSIQLPTNGGTRSFQITSNTTWKIS